MTSERRVDVKVKCTTGDFSFFTKGKIYDVICIEGEREQYFVVKDDEGDTLALFQSECEVVEQ